MVFPNLKQYNVVVCAIVKDEDPYLLEWIAYHRVIGVEHFLIYDNESTDNTSKILKSLERTGIVTYRYWPKHQNQHSQRTAYQDAHQTLLSKSNWITFIDLDEFIVLHQHQDIHHFLNNYKDIAGFVINWKLFGSSGHLDKTDGLVIERFTKCANINDQEHCNVKSIVRADYIQSVGIHTCLFKENSRCIYPDGTLCDTEVKGQRSYINHEIAQINHYKIKSRAEWEMKAVRGRPLRHRAILPETYFKENDKNEIEDLSIFSLIEKTKEEMKDLIEVAGLHQVVSWGNDYTQNSNNDQDHISLARVMSKQEKMQESIASYQNAIALQPEQKAIIYQELANAIAKQDKILEAISLYHKFLTLEKLQEYNNNSKSLYLCLGEVLVQLGIKHNYLKELASFFQDTCDQHSDHPTHYYNLATVLARRSQFDEAINQFRKVISVDSRFHQAHVELGRILELKKGDENQAFNHYINALKVKPRSGEINDLCVSTIQKLSNWMSSKRIERKIKIYQKVIENLDDTQINLSRTYISFGKLLRKFGRIKEAIEYNQKASYYKLERNYPELLIKGSPQEKFNFKEPSFIVIGVMKCGTTSLYDYTTKHPKIIQSLVKELHFFDEFINNLEKDDKNSKSNFDFSDVDKQLYLSYFLPVSQEQGLITGEATPSYLTTYGVEKLVFNSFPNVKLIVILRDPVKRAISQYNMGLRGGKQNSPLETVIEKELKTYEDLNDFSNIVEKRPRGLLLRGLYVYFLQEWMKLFPKEQFLILRTEDLSENPAVVMKQVFEFLDLPDYTQIQYSTRNKGNYSSEIDQDLLTRLYNFYQPHNQRLEEFLGRKFDWDYR